jgi:hypothetical protein
MIPRILAEAKRREIGRGLTRITWITRRSMSLRFGTTGAEKVSSERFKFIKFSF